VAVSARARRARKLLAVATARVGTRERELLDARRVVEEREQDEARARSALADAFARELDVATADELAYASAHQRTLALRIARAAALVSAARGELAAREQALVEARRDERRMEILVEGIERAVATKAEKAERRVMDEHASRRASLR